MKNTFLKKVAAAALAAVMAITFAPVASLNAFAASNPNISGSDTIIGTPASVTTAGSYHFDFGRTPTAVTVNLNATNMKGTYNFDLTGYPETVIFDIKNAASKTANDAVTVNIKGDKKAVSTLSIIFGKVKLTGTTSKYFDVNLSGNLVLDDDSTKTTLRDAVGSNPVATVGDTLLLGNEAINAYEGSDADAGDVVAFNGNVNVTSLPSGHSATVAENVWSYGTKIEAKAAPKTALATVVTKLNYETVISGPNGTNGRPQYSVPLSRVYTENAYYAGYDRISSSTTRSVLNTPVPCSGYFFRSDVDRDGTTISGIEGTTRTGAQATVTTSKYGLKGYVIEEQPVKLISKSKEYLYNEAGSPFDGYTEWNLNTTTYDQAITIDQNGEDWTGKTINNYVADFDSTRSNGDLNGITYYTADPTSFTKSEDGIAVIDGTKWVVSDIYPNELWYAASKFASKSVDIKRGAEIDASADDDYAYERFTSRNDLTVTAPADMSIVKATSDNVTGRYKWTSNEWRVFGTKRFSSSSDFYQNYDFPYKAENETKTNNNVYVAQVASGATIAIYVEPRVGLSRADGIGYYTTDDETKYTNIIGWKNGYNTAVFGKAKEVTDSFKGYVTGLKTDANVYASKEIKTTVAGVDPDVAITGEINADVIETVNDKNTWDVNTNAAKEKSQVTAHRMYSGREHVYTADPNEIKMLVAAGWKDEGVAFTVNAVASGKGTPIYRVYNKNNGGMHFYTASAAEKDMLLANGWIEGKPVFYGADKATGIPVYRTYNTGSNNGEHNYTTNIAESEMNVQKGWRAEGVAFYVFK